MNLMYIYWTKHIYDLYEIHMYGLYEPDVYVLDYTHIRS